MENPSQLSGVCLGLCQLLLITSLTVKPSRFRWTFWPAIAGNAYYFVFYTTSGSVTTDYALACVIFTYLFVASDYILLTDVQRELRLVGQRGPPSSLSLFGRLKWALNLFTSPRGVGWTHEPASALPPHPIPTTRSAFILSQILWAALCLIFFDIAQIFNRRNPSFATGGPSIAAFGWIIRSFSVFGFAVPTVAMLSIQYCFYGAACVAIGIWKPQDFPPLFGSVHNAYTIQRFWGRTWHQLLRRSISSHGRFLARRVLGLKRGSTSSTLVQLYTAFFLSGLIHYFSEYMLLHHWGGGAMRFFLLQAVAITFERGVMTLVSRTGIKTRSSVMWKAFGYLWVWQWFTWCLPVLLDPLFSAGLIEDGLNVSLLEGLWSGTWTPKFPARTYQ